MTAPITPLVPGMSWPQVTRGGGPAGVAGRFAGRRPLPLPTIPSGRSHWVRYAMTAVDAGGRLSDRALLEYLGWAPGTSVTLDTTVDTVIVAYPAPGGGQRVSTQGRLRLPAALRHRCGLRAGDRLLLAADQDTARLRLYPPAALDALLPDPTARPANQPADQSTHRPTTGGHR